MADSVTSKWPKCAQPGCRRLVTLGSPSPDFCSHQCWSRWHDSQGHDKVPARADGMPAPKLDMIPLRAMRANQNCEATDEGADPSEAFSWLDVRAPS